MGPATGICWHDPALPQAPPGRLFE